MSKITEIAWTDSTFNPWWGCTHLDWLLLTKRIGNSAEMMDEAMANWSHIPDNIWLGATVCDQKEADRDIPKLLKAPYATKRFLSMEPLLGPVDLTKLMK